MNTEFGRNLKIVATRPLFQNVARNHFTCRYNTQYNVYHEEGMASTPTLYAMDQAQTAGRMHIMLSETRYYVV